MQDEDKQMKDQAIWLTVRRAMLLVCDAIERWYYLSNNGRDKDIGQDVITSFIPSDELRSGSEKIEVVKPKRRRTTSGVSSI
jgi:hypothetical protein